MRCAALTALLAGMLTAVVPIGSAHAETGYFVHVGYGQATYTFPHGESETFHRQLIDLEAGISRAIAWNGDLRWGMSLNAQLAPDRALKGSYSLISLDALKLLYQRRAGIQGQLGFGVVLALADVNEAALGVSLGLGYDLGPLTIGLHQAGEVVVPHRGGRELGGIDEDGSVRFRLAVVTV